MILLDTNIPVYAMDSSSLHHRACRDVIDRSLSAAIPSVLFPQILLEMYASVTSPRRISNPISPEDALIQLSALRAAIPVLPLRTRALDELEALIAAAQRRGPHVYDLFLVAQMRSHGIREICTLNGRDFQFPDIIVHSPEALA